jgi:hypothetical protein
LPDKQEAEVKKQQPSGAWKPSWRDWLWLALYLLQIGLGVSLLGVSAPNRPPAIRLDFSIILTLGALAVVLAVDLQAFLVSRERWAVAGQMLLTIAALACLSLLAGNSTIGVGLSVALIGLGTLASVGLLVTRLVRRRQ